jgi:hypothetical protein
VSRKNFSVCRDARSRACWIALSRGARTRACRVHTRVNAWVSVRVNAQPRISARPRIILDPRNQAGLHRIPLDVASNAVPLLLVANPVIVRLTLPELLAGMVQQSIGLACGRSLKRFQKMGRRYDGPQEYVNVVGHDYEGSKLVVAELDSSVQGVYEKLGDAGLSQRPRTHPCCVEVAVNPGESFSRRGFGRWREPAGRKASVQRPGYEKPPTLGIRMGKPAAGVHDSLVVFHAIKSRVHTSVNAARKSACATKTSACATAYD